MLSNSQSGKQRIAQALLLSVFYPVQYTVSLSSNIGNIFAENKRLRLEVAMLRTKLLLSQEDANTHLRMDKLYEAGDRLSYDLYPARVVVRDPSYILRSIAINAGSADNVVVNMPVINQDGLVGKVIQVLPHVSRVHLIKDPSCKTSVMIKRSRTIGILETDNGSNFFFKCQEHSNVQSGDTVLTSGLGGIYPKGLIAGIVSHIEIDNDPLFKIVYIQTAVNFDHLEEVFVIRVSPQWSALNQDMDSLQMEKP